MGPPRPLEVLEGFGGKSKSKAPTLEYLIAEQDGIREQGGILSQKVKQAGWNKRAGWNFVTRS